MIWETIFAILLFLLPTQLGRHFWPKEAFLFGLKVDFLSPTLYLQDLLFLFLFIPWLKRNFLKIFSQLKREKKYVILSLFYIFLYLSYFIFNIAFSPTPLISFFSWLRLTELIFLGMMVYSSSKIILFFLGQILPFTIIFEFILGLAQAWRQSSLGGFFWLLGERNFNVFTPGIARASLLGKVLLRPYGTFSHPNSLAGFVLVALILIFGQERLRLLDKIAVACGFVLILFSFSRTVWLTAFLLGLVFILAKLINWFFTKNLTLNFPYLAVALSLPLILYSFSKTVIDSSSFLIRQDLTKIALALIRENPLFGVGAGRFIINLSQVQVVWPSLYWLQPVHNIFLLIGSELGILGLLGFLYLIVLTIKRLLTPPLLTTNYLLLAALFSVLFTGLFDHYWLTLIQNQLLFTLILALSLSLGRSSSFPRDKTK